MGTCCLAADAASMDALARRLHTETAGSCFVTGSSGPEMKNFFILDFKIHCIMEEIYIKVT